MIIPQKEIANTRIQVKKDAIKENWNEYCCRKSKIPLEINKKIKNVISDNRSIISFSRAFNPLILLKTMELMRKQGYKFAYMNTTNGFIRYFIDKKPTWFSKWREMSEIKKLKKIYGGQENS